MSNTDAQNIEDPIETPIGLNQQTHFSRNSLAENIDRILSHASKTYELNGLILYLSNFDEQTLDLVSASGTTCSRAKLFSIQLPMEISLRRSFAAHIYNRKMSDFVPDSHKSELFCKDTLGEVGVSGAAFGMPLRLGHQSYGVLIAWAKPHIFSVDIKNKLKVKAKIVASMLAKSQLDGE